MNWTIVSYIIYGLLALSFLVFLTGYYLNRKNKKLAKEIINNNPNNLELQNQVTEIMQPKKASIEDKITAKFNFSKAPKEYKLIQQVTGIGTLMRFGRKFHAAVIEDKGKLWLENKEVGFFVEKPDDRQLVIIDNQEGFLYKQINNQWLLQGYNLSNGQGNNIYTVDEQSDFLRTLEAKFWQYQGKGQLNKDKWSFWGLVILGLLIMFALGMNFWQTKAFMNGVQDMLDDPALSDTDKALMLQIIQNQDKITKQNVDLITTIKDKNINSNVATTNQEGVVFK